MSFRVILADDHTLVRKGIARLLQGDEEIEVIAEAGSGDEAVGMVAELAPEVVLMDVKMPIVDGPEATRRILAGKSETKVIALSGYSDLALVRAMLRAGARGYIMKDCDIDEMRVAVRVVAEGGVFIGSRVVDKLVDEYLRLAGTHSELAGLTEREREVLRYVAEGRSSKDIASLLDLSIKTVEGHRSSIAKKLNVKSVADLVRFAVREGLVEA